MRRKNNSTAMNYSLTEFSYFLLFIFIGTSVISGGALIKLHKQVDEYTRKIEKLENEKIEMTKEINYLEKTLKELKNGAVPCWKRPGSPVPEIAGTIIIEILLILLSSIIPGKVKL